MTTTAETTTKITYPIKTTAGWLIGPPREYPRAPRVRRCRNCGGMQPNCGHTEQPPKAS